MYGIVAWLLSVEEAGSGGNENTPQNEINFTSPVSL